MPASEATQIVLVGHGSRSPEANASLVALARAAARDLELPVLAAYLEMAEPSIPSALRAAVASGARRIITVPYFLSPGMHVRRDIVEIVDAARAELGVTIEISDFFGNHPEVPRLLSDVVRRFSGTFAAATASQSSADQHSNRSMTENFMQDQQQLQNGQTTTWPELAEGLYAFLTGRGATIEYSFENMQISVPSSTHADAPSAPWRLNGTMRVRTFETKT